MTFVLLATALAGSARARPDGPPPPVPPEAPIPIFLSTPADRETFWKMLGHPDAVILDGELYRKLRQSAEAAKPAAPVVPAVVESLAVAGEVVGDWARLTAEYRVAMETDGPTWVPIQLDGLTLSEAREGPRDLATRIAEGRAWQVELRGKGEHIVRVGLLAPVRSTAEGRRLDLPIPPVASTRVELVVPQSVLDASTGVNEMVAVVPVEGGTGAKFSARLSPRSRIELAWRERVDSALKLPALLSAQGEIAVDIERGLIRTRSSWFVGSVRGTANQLAIRLDAAEEVLDVEVDGRPVQVETRREGGRQVVFIPLAEPLRPNTNRSLLLTTRRPIASSGTARVTLQGYTFDQAKVQSGAIAIARTGPLFLNPTPGRGLRRIDPRTELPENLRSRADIMLAFEFNDQPFDLNLSVEPAPPRLRVESRSTVTIEPRSARIQTRLDCRTSQGRVFEVQVLLPKGLEFEGAGPPEVVESAQLISLDPKASPVGSVDVPRVLSIVLTPQAREAGEAEAFTIQLKGWCAIDPSGPVALPLFGPVVDSTTGGRFAVVSDRNVSVDLASAGDEPSGFLVDWGSPPSDWTWPVRRPGPELGLLWLRCDSTLETLPLRVTIHPRSIRHESSLTASVDRRGADVVDEVSCEVAFGTLSRLDLALPPEVPARWEVEGVELAGREPLGQDSDGSRRYRLRFARDYADSFRLRIRYRVPFGETPAADRDGRLRLNPIRVLEGTSTGRRVVVSAEPGFDIKSEAKGWSTIVSPDPSSPSEAGLPVRIALAKADEKAGPVTVVVRTGPQLPLPGVVVSRLWIRTIQRPEDDLDTSAYFWAEARTGSMEVGLPAGSRWVRGKVGTTEVGEGQVEVEAPDEYRLRFPASNSSGPILVEIDYIVPASATWGGWPAPKVLGGGVVQQTAWEVQVLGTRAGVGTPSGWTDENEWYCDGLLWRRRPWKNPAELAQWLNGGSTRFPIDNPLESGEQGGNHRYLFSRVGPPTPLRFAVYSRFTLLLLCSGPVLLAGLLVLARRPPPRVIATMLLILAFAVGALVEPNVNISMLQSSALGVGLLLTALAMNWAIERRGHARPNGDPGPIVGPSAIVSSLARAPSVGSDDSTAIRPRPTTPSAISTADHIVLTRPPDELSTSDLNL